MKLCLYRYGRRKLQRLHLCPGRQRAYLRVRCCEPAPRLDACWAACCHPAPLQLGRASPADIVISIPTVSTRHAMLRVADPESPAPGSVQVQLAPLLAMHLHWSLETWQCAAACAGSCVLHAQGDCSPCGAVGILL